MKKDMRKRFCLAPLAALILLSGCSEISSLLPLEFKYYNQNDDFVEVEDIIISISKMTAGTPAYLSGYVMPLEASRQRIVWTVDDAGDTGAYIDASDSSVLHAERPGIVKMIASVSHALKTDRAKEKAFSIVVSETVIFQEVTGIARVPTTALAKTMTRLTGVVRPVTATNQAITWELAVDGGANVTVSPEGFFWAENEGDVVVSAVIEDGLAVGVPYTELFPITVNGSYVPVEDISLAVPLAEAAEDVIFLPKTGEAQETNPLLAAAGREVILSDAEVIPRNATNREILWIVTDDGGTGAVIETNQDTGETRLRADWEGDVTLMAVIDEGLSDSPTPMPYTQEIILGIRRVFVPVDSITDVPEEGVAGTPLTLSARVTPQAAYAVNQDIDWYVRNGGGTGAVIENRTLTAYYPGTVKIYGMVPCGLSLQESYVSGDFDINIVAGDDMDTLSLTSTRVFPETQSCAVGTEPTEDLAFTVTGAVSGTAVETAAGSIRCEWQRREISAEEWETIAGSEATKAVSADWTAEFSYQLAIEDTQEEGTFCYRAKLVLITTGGDDTRQVYSPAGILTVTAQEEYVPEESILTGMFQRPWRIVE